MKIEHIIKRDFSTSPFHLDKITQAIQKAMDSVGVGNAENAQDVALSVYQKLLNRKSEDQDYTPTIEEVQDKDRSPHHQLCLHRSELCDILLVHRSDITSFQRHV